MKKCFQPQYIYIYNIYVYICTCIFCTDMYVTGQSNASIATKYDMSVNFNTTQYGNYIIY